MKSYRRLIVVILGVIGLAGTQPVSGEQKGFSPPASDQKVTLEAAWLEAGEAEAHRRIAVDLTIAEGWHVNANPASLDFLIPTQVGVHLGDQELEVEPEYPVGEHKATPLGDQKIAIYRGKVTIPVHWERLPAKQSATGPLIVSARVQACSERGRCLPPTTLQTKLAWPPASAQ